MRIIRSPEKLTQAVRQLKSAGKRVGFVPTMGALHAGHLSLIRRAVRENDSALVSIFVNPAQFSPAEDLKSYPRSLNRDLSLCRKEGVKLLFLPRAKDMYPPGFRTYVEVEGLNSVLCGAKRPGHFRGVSTVVLKLFNIVPAHVAYFGQKDAQQAVIIKRMVKDLNLAVKIKVLPTVREKDGLAFSSRNAYLSPVERKEAPVLYGALRLAASLIRNGERSCAKIMARMRSFIKKSKGATIDYISIVEAEGLKPLKKVSRSCLVALAVKIGKARLIDNMLVRA